MTSALYNIRGGTKVFQKHVFMLIALGLLAVIFGLSGPGHAQEAIVLELAIPWGGFDIPNAVKVGVERFEQANPGVTVEVLTMDAEGFLARMAGGLPPDLFIPFELAVLSEKGLIIPVDEYIERDERLKQVIIPEMWDQSTWNGRVWGLPALEHGPRYGMIWDVQAAAESGIAVNSDEVLTWAEFFDAADKLTRIGAHGEVERIGYNPRDGQNTRLYTVAPLWGAEDYYSLEHIRIDHPRVVDMLQFTSDRWFGKYPNLWAFGEDWYGIAPGRSATVNLGGYGPGEIEFRNPDRQIQVAWPPHDDRQRTQLLDGWTLTIPADSSHPDLSFQLASFIATDVESQIHKFHAVGWLGTSIEFYEEMSRTLEPDHPVRWYIQSMVDADQFSVLTADPYTFIATDIFRVAAWDVFAQKGSAKTLLEDAQRILENRMREDGRL